MTNCKQCGKEIESHTGRAPKKYCNEDCRDAYYLATRPEKQKKTVHIATYRLLEEENKGLRNQIKELLAGNPVMDRGALNLPPVNGSDSPALEGGSEKHKIKYVNTGTISSSTVDATDVSQPQDTIFTPTKEDEIARLEGEKALLQKGQWGDKMRKTLQKQIDKLKYS